MSNFLSDFGIFLNYMFNTMTSIYNWLTSTVLGEIIIFVVLISIFLFVVHLIIQFKD